MIIYMWNSYKRTKKIHIKGSDGFTLCSVENSGTKIDDFGEKPPEDRKVCRICKKRHAEGWKERRQKNRKKKSKPGKKNFFKTDTWARLKYDALRLSNGHCGLCGHGPEHGVTLHVDHIKLISKHPELIDKLSNLQVLCATCNWGKGARYEDDWREPSLAKLMGEEQ